MCEGRWDATSVGSCEVQAQPLTWLRRGRRTTVEARSYECRYGRSPEEGFITPTFSSHWFVRIKVCFSVKYDSPSGGNSLFEAMG